MTNEDASRLLKTEAISHIIPEVREALWMGANALEQEPKTGHWKRRIVDNGNNADWVCSECGFKVMTDYVSYNYCPNCGAKMEGKE